MRNPQNIIQESAIRERKYPKLHSLTGCWPDKMSKSYVHGDDLKFKGIQGKSFANHEKAWKQFLYYYGDAREDLEKRMPTIQYS